MRTMVIFFRVGILFLLAFSARAQDSLTVREARREVVLTGYTRSPTVITLSSEVSGRITAVHYQEGDVVGDKPFVEIDTTFIDFEMERVRKSRKRLAALQEKNASRILYLENEFLRIENLFKGDRAPEVKRDAAREELAQARLEEKTLAAEDALLQVQLEELKERRRRHRVGASPGLILVEKRVETHDLVTTGQPLGRAADFRRLVVPLSVSGEELAAIRRMGDTFEALLEGGPVKTALHWVNPEFDEKTRKLAVELLVKEEIPDSRGGLRLTLPLSVASEGIWVPRAAVIDRYQHPRVILKSTGETVTLMVLGESNGYLIASENPRLPPGTELAAP